MSLEFQDPREVVAGLLDDPRLREACAQRDMGALFRLLNHRGVSTRRLASAVNITQGRLYDYMNGRSRVEKLTLFEQIVDAFHIPGHFLGLARRDWEPPLNTHTPSPVALPHPNDTDDLTAVDAFREADRQAGGGRLYKAVVQHLSDRVAPRLLDAGTNSHIFAAAAALTEMAGWMAHDSGQDDLASRHFTRARPLASIAGDSALAANISASNSHLALQSGDASKAAHWALDGLNLLRQAPGIPALAARLHAMHARALAAAGQSDQAMRALDTARMRLASTANAAHPWTSPFDAAALASESALALRDLGKVADALVEAERAIELRTAGRARSLALSRITLVGLHVHRDDLDEAVAAGNDLLNTSPMLGSIRVVHQLDELYELLAAHRSYRPVHDYLTRFDEARRARMLLLADILTSGGDRS
ncbi:XRE family transcriptional regulator [Streptomyces sp. NPDC001107]